MAVEARPLPSVRDGMSVVSVKTATINQLSGMVRAGQVPAAKPPLVLGNEGAGIVESSRRFAPGTRVVVYGSNLNAYPNKKHSGVPLLRCKHSESPSRPRIADICCFNILSAHSVPDKLKTR
nr:hypothetical protein RSP597_23235 [Ralstonia solanacearum]